ncbi:MAG: acyl carrier protein [Pseudomonadota bacterium]
MQFEDLQGVMADVMEVEPEAITPEATPDDIDTWDSLRLLELVLAIEKNFGVSLPADRIQDMISVPAILAIIAEAERCAA